MPGIPELFSTMMNAWQIGGLPISSPMYLAREPVPIRCCQCIGQLKCAGNQSLSRTGVGGVRGLPVHSLAPASVCVEGGPLWPHPALPCPLSRLTPSRLVPGSKLVQLINSGNHRRGVGRSCSIGSACLFFCSSIFAYVEPNRLFLEFLAGNNLISHSPSSG